MKLKYFMILQLQIKGKRVVKTPACTECTQDPTNGRARTRERHAENAAGKPPPTSRCSPRSGGGLRSAPLCCNFPGGSADRTSARSAPSGRSCLLCRGQACHLGLAHGQARVLPSPRLGPTGSPPLHSPPTGAGSTLSWGSRGTTSSLSDRPQCHRCPLEGSPRRRPGSRQKPQCSQQAAPTCTLTWDPPSSQLGRPASLSSCPQRSSWSGGSVHTHPRPPQP